MGGADLKGFFRGMSKARSSVIMCIMLILDAILKQAKRAWSDCEGQPGDDVVSRDLEIGDPDCERQRGCEGQRARSMPYPDEYNIFGNPWKKGSLDSLVGPRSVRVPTPGGDTLRGLDARDDDELLHPDAFDIHLKDRADPFAEPTPPPHSPYAGLVHLRAISTFDLNNNGDEDAETGEIGAAPIVDRDSTSAGPDTAAPSSSTTNDEPPLPHWLVARKATAGPRAPRFMEGDVDDPTDIAPPPDLKLLERLPITMARTRMARGSTWSPGQDGGGEEPPKPAVGRLRPCSV